MLEKLTINVCGQLHCQDAKPLSNYAFDLQDDLAIDMHSNDLDMDDVSVSNGSSGDPDTCKVCCLTRAALSFSFEPGFQKSDVAFR